MLSHLLNHAYLTARRLFDLIKGCAVYGDCCFLALAFVGFLRASAFIAQTKLFGPSVQPLTPRYAKLEFSSNPSFTWHLF